MTARISILMYHQVGEFAPMKAHRANYCDHRRFAAQMGFLHRFGYSVLGLGDALSLLVGNGHGVSATPYHVSRCRHDRFPHPDPLPEGKGDLDRAARDFHGKRPIPPRAVVLTFDDAYANFLDYALPVLKRYAFPATVYAISGYLGRNADWFAKDPGRSVPRLMTGDELRGIRAQGISVGSHSASHIRLGEADIDTQRRELGDSKSALEDLLGEEIRHLCYPFGSFNRETVQAAQEAGYASATTCLRGTAERCDHPLLLPRKGISFGDNLLGYFWKLSIKQAPKPALVEWRRRLAAGTG
jgi:peptidoglycan/xylan/chitin deacetylase (PgdA/CDA1 family)